MPILSLLYQWLQGDGAMGWLFGSTHLQHIRDYCNCQSITLYEGGLVAQASAQS